MIRLMLPKCSEELERMEGELTARFVADRAARVWDKPYIREPLLSATHHKCAYCERRIGLGAGDVHIDHFRPKSRYPDEVVQWGNLLPACGHCNRNKSDFDTAVAPIANPFFDEPHKLFYLKNCRYCPLERDPESIGARTIDVLNLNDLNDECLPRFQVVSCAVDKLSQELKYAAEQEDALRNDVRKRNRARTVLRDILRMCVPNAVFSAFVATAVRRDEGYAEYKNLLQRVGAWDDELEGLERQSDVCVFPDGPESDKCSCDLDRAR